MVSTSHYNAEYYFDRDVQCVRTFFQRKFGFESSEYPQFKDYNKNENNLDVEIQASGFTKSHQTHLEQYVSQSSFLLSLLNNNNFFD